MGEDRLGYFLKYIRLYSNNQLSDGYLEERDLISRML